MTIGRVGDGSDGFDVDVVTGAVVGVPLTPTQPNAPKGSPEQSEPASGFHW